MLGDGRIVAGGDSSYGSGLLGWFNSRGALLSQEQLYGTFGGVSSVQQVIAVPQGGVTIVGYASPGGTAVEYHAAPGSAADRLVLNPGSGYALSGGVSLAGGKLVATNVAGGLPMFDLGPPGGKFGVVRLADPGAAHSATTFVRWQSWTNVPDGQAVLSATVLPLLGDPVTEGTITFREGATVLGTIDLRTAAPAPWGSPTSVSVTLSPGDHTITAEYSGTARWAVSSAPATFRAGAATAVTATLSVSNTNPAFGEQINLTAQLTPVGFGFPPGVGTVTFYDGATELGVGNVFAGGVAFLSTAALTGGPHALRAVYSGGTGFSPAESAPVSVLVMQEVTEVTLTASAATAVVGQSVRFTATVRNPFRPGVGGTVTFYDGSTILGSAPVGASGVAAYATTLRLGAHTIARFTPT